jgi:hypothetical protein
MITVNIGKLFLEAYNEAHSTDYTPREFFDEVFFKMFLDSNKYMMWVTNSPFVQLKSGEKVSNISAERRLELLEAFHEKVNNGSIDASTAVGFPASEEKEFNTTSGQVSDIAVALSPEDAYCSWFGAALGVGIEGGYNMLFQDKELLLKIAKGWSVYRRFLDDTSINIAPNKISSWNGQWLLYFLETKGKETPIIRDFEERGAFKKPKNGEVEIETVPWSKLCFRLSKHHKKEHTSGSLLTYVYAFGQTNKTFGFYPMKLHEVRRLIELYKKLFGEQAAIKDASTYEALYGSSLKYACQKGALGLAALEPRDLRKKYSKEEISNMFKKHKDSQKDLEKNIIPFRTYKTWLLAMITKNKEEQLHYSEAIARRLHELLSTTAERKKGTTLYINLVNELLSAESKYAFFKALHDLVKELPGEEDLSIFKELRDYVHGLPIEDFRYFAVLLRLDYAFIEREKSK